jgi:exopolysaccharide biosynthesis operon protein EpsL
VTAAFHARVNFCATGAVAAALAAALPAAAQERALSLRLSSVISWDSNVFRIPDTSPDPQSSRGVSGRSDRIATSTVGLRFNKDYAQQSLSLELSQTATRHDRFESLNRDAFEYRGSLRWHLTPRVSGVLSTSRTESLVSFEDTQGVQQIVRVTTNRSATLDGWLFGGWHLLAGATETRTSSSQTFAAQPDSRQAGGEFGLRYVAPSQSTISIVRRSLDGTNIGQNVDLVNFRDSGFTTQETEVNASWVATGRSTFGGRLMRTSRRHEHVPERDVSATIRELRYAWVPTGKLSFSLSAARNITPFLLGLQSSYRVDDSVELAPVWRMTEKISLRLNASRRTAEFLGAIGPTAGLPRRDAVRSIEFGANWSPHERVSLRANLSRERRTSTEAAAHFEGSIATVSATLTF